MKEHRISKLNNKRGYSTEGSTLLPSVLRPRLFGVSDKDKVRANTNAQDDALFKFGFSIRIGLVALSALTLGTIVVQASNVSATSATLSVPDSISVNVNPYENNGFAESSIGKVEISTGNQAGYTLSIRAKDNNQLKNGDNVLNSITTNLSTDEYINGSNGDSFFNTWGFKPDVVNSLVNTSYIPGPNTNGIVLAKTNTNSLAPETFNLAIATKVNQDTTAGNYTNSFILTGLANTATYTIRFDNNGGEGGPTKPQTGDIGENLEVQIESETPSMEDKDFLGWCTKKPKEDGSCTGVIVQPAGCFPLCKCDLDITLYAMYGTKSSGNSGGTWSGTGNDGADCSAPGYDGPAKSYGGLCWMWKDYKTNVNWDTAMSSCPNDWRLPSDDDFRKLLGVMGTDGRLYYNGWSDVYISSTTNSDYMDGILVSNDVLRFTSYLKTTSLKVRCVTG